MEIPSRIRYDFLLVLLGFLLVIFPLVSPLLGIGNLDTLPSIITLIAGVFLMIQGIGLIRDDYYLDMELKELEYARKKVKYIEFFESKGVITKKSKDGHEKDIKEIIN